MEKQLWNHVQTVRQQSPLVQNIANFVVMNNTANALLAVGASPIMAHGHGELEDMARICASLVINIGTLDEYWVESMTQSAMLMQRQGKPWVLDPVGAGASWYRNSVLGQLMRHRPSVIRGNASEIMALAASSGVTTKGVDSTASSDQALDAAKHIHRQFDCVVCVSGATDIIVGKGVTAYIHNGHPLMTRVTGLGCSASAIIGAFVASVHHTVEAVAATMALMGVCGELAAIESVGPGSLQVNLLNKLHNITESEFMSTVRISHVD